MLSTVGQPRNSFLRRIINTLIMVCFLAVSVCPPSLAQNILNLPEPGMMVPLTPAFEPPVLKGIKIYPDNPLRFDFFVDTEKTNLQGDELKIESEKLIRYFLASLTVPEKDLWVNLSPFEKDRIIPEKFGTTEMGRDLLAQDYLLKQLTASLMYPEGELGKTFWDKVYQKAYELYGTTDIPVNTFNKVWIMPDKAVVYENKDVAFIVESRLKVMLEKDYLAYEKSRGGVVEGIGEIKKEDQEKTADVSEDMVRNLIIPEIEKEVNQGESFKFLRQIYNSLILATWFKKNLRESFLGKVYLDQNKVAGVDLEDKEMKEKIYEQYLEAYKVGVYNYIKDDFDQYTQEVIPRKYFSGGIVAGQIDLRMEVTHNPEDASMAVDKTENCVKVEATVDPAQTKINPKKGDPKITALTVPQRLPDKQVFNSAGLTVIKWESPDGEFNVPIFGGQHPLPVQVAENFRRDFESPGASHLEAIDHIRQMIAERDPLATYQESVSLVRGQAEIMKEHGADGFDVMKEQVGLQHAEEMILSTIIDLADVSKGLGLIEKYIKRKYPKLLKDAQLKGIQSIKELNTIVPDITAYEVSIISLLEEVPDLFFHRPKGFTVMLKDLFLDGASFISDDFTTQIADPYAFMGMVGMRKGEEFVSYIPQVKNLIRKLLVLKLKDKYLFQKVWETKQLQAYARGYQMVMINKVNINCQLNIIGLTDQERGDPVFQLIRLIGLLKEVPSILTQETPFVGYAIPLGAGIKFVDRNSKVAAYMPFHEHIQITAEEEIHFLTRDNITSTNPLMIQVLNELRPALYQRLIERLNELSLTEELSFETLQKFGVRLSTAVTKETVEGLNMYEETGETDEKWIVWGMKLSAEEMKLILGILETIPEHFRSILFPDKIMAIDKKNGLEISLQHFMGLQGRIYGEYSPWSQKISLYYYPVNNYTFSRIQKDPKLLQFFKETILHEIGEALYDALPDDIKEKWTELSGWGESETTPEDSWLSGQHHVADEEINKAFVTTYAQNSPNDDFAEHFVALVFHGDEFRKLTEQDPEGLIAAKHAFLVALLGAYQEDPSPFTLEELKGDVEKISQKMKLEEAITNQRLAEAKRDQEALRLIREEGIAQSWEGIIDKYFIQQTKSMKEGETQSAVLAEGFISDGMEHEENPGIQEPQDIAGGKLDLDEEEKVNETTVRLPLSWLGEIGLEEEELVVDPNDAETLYGLLSFLAIKYSRLANYLFYNKEISPFITVLIDDKEVDLANVNRVNPIPLSPNSQVVISDDTSTTVAQTKKPKNRDDSMKIKREGGINFNPENLNLETRGGGIDIPQVDMQQLENMQIDGFVPVIINITPVTNLMMILGLSDQEEKPADAATTSSPTPKEISKRELPAIREQELVGELRS